MNPDALAAISKLDLEQPRPLRTTPSTGSKATQFPLADRWASHPGVGLTPERIGGIFRSAETGYPWQQCDLFDDVLETDAHLRSLFDTRISGVAGKDWILQAGGGDPADIKAALILEEALRWVPNTSDTFAHQLTSMIYGYAGSEIIWERYDGYTIPVWFANVPARRFVFDEEDVPRLLTARETTKGIPLEPGRWWWSRRRHRLTAAAGLMRTACWYSLFKRLSLSDWVIFIDHYAMPYPVGRYRPGTNAEEKAVLEQAVRSLGTDGYAIFSEDGTIEFAKIERGGGADSPYAAMCGLCNTEMSKLVTGATLTSGEGTSVGSYALGRVHETRLFDLISEDALQLQRSFKAQISMPFMIYNGLPGKPPRLRVHLVRDVDPAVRMDLYSRAANELGLAIDEDQFRQEFQMPTPTGSALVGTGKAAAPKPPGAPPDAQ
jgi:phage gp29-like protein